MSTKFFFPILLFAILGLTFSACVDQEFDDPPVRGLPGVEANYTIAQLKQRHTINANADSYTLIDTNIIVSGIVVGNDVSGNIFKELIIEDATGGVAIRLDNTGLYTLYPEGTEVFIKLNGLYIGDYRGRYQISVAAGERIPGPLVAQYVVAGEQKVAVPTSVTLAELLASPQLQRSMESRLLSIEGTQFASSELGQTYAVAGGGTTRNRMVEDCSNNSIIVRLSDFSDFASTDIPEGNGTLKAVFSLFGTTPQLIVREEADMAFTGMRCGGGGGGTGGNLVSIQSVRAAFTGATTTAPDNSKIRGVVISDRANGNLNGRNLFIQDGTAGIAVRFAANHSFNLGEEVEITVSGQELSEFNGLLQLNNIPLANVATQGAGTLPTPRAATVAQILANGSAWESTLVRVSDATLNGGPTYGNGVTVADGTGSLSVFTLLAATFSGNNIPTGTGSLTGIVSDFNGLQMLMRNAADASFQGGGGGETVLVTVASLRSAFAGGSTAAPANTKIRGIVTCDVGNANITGRNAVIQDASGGIIVRFSANHTFALGEELEITVSGMELSEFNGLLQLNNVPNANAISFGPGTLPTPRVATIQEVIANLEAWESTLVRINNVTIPAGGTYSGTKTMQDATGNLDLFTRTAASFSTSNVPSGTFSIIGVVSQFTSPQLNIRNLNDIIQ